MAGDEELATSAPPAKRAAPPRPTISLPPRASMGAFFGDASGGFSLAGLGFSPGPMTLVSSLFSPTDEFKSFSQLLAGAMASPAAQQASQDDRGFKQNRPDGLVLSPAAAMFMVPPGLSPATLLDSPGIFSPRQGPFGMTHQEALAQVTAQAQAAIQVQSQIPNQTEENTTPPLSQTTNSDVVIVDPPLISQQPEQSSSQTISYAADNRPANDGYNWRKYGQKQVKGSAFPRSYYKCSHPNCPVKKKVEHALDGHVREIIYKGQHNHPPPQKKRAKESAVSENSNVFFRRDQELSETVPELSSAASDSEEVDDSGVGNGERDGDEPEAKRRNMEVAAVPEQGSVQRTVTESRIIVQTRSEVDLLDDGYRWRKYGQKVVKGNPYPRSYYKCTMQGCNVRKHVERAAADPKSVITTYEGKHNHTVPAAKNSISNNNTTMLQRPNQSADAKREMPKETNLQQVGRLRFKDEQNG